MRQFFIISACFSVFLFIACTHHIESEPFKLDYDKKIPSSVAKEDLTALKQVLEEAQTSLYMYTSESELDALFDSITTFSDDSIEYLDLIRRITRFQNAIACGHSGWGHPKSYKAYRNTDMRFFPLTIQIIDEKYYIHDSYYPSKDSINGAEILTLNQTPVVEITQQLKKHMVRDGFSSPDGIKEIAQYFKMAYSNFIDNPDVFHLTIRQSGILRDISIKALTLSEINDIHKPLQSNLNSIKQALQYEYKPELGAGWLTIKSFRNEYIQHYGQHFSSYIDSAFTEIQKRSVNRLFIDLRGNTGGWTSNGRHLFSYFINQPMDYIKKVEVKKYKDYTFDSLIVSPPGYLDTFDLNLSSSGMYEWSNYPSLKVLPQERNVFNGTVYILIDEMSKSCSAVFSALMQDHNDAICIGNETGASKCGTSGIVMAIELPQTKIPIHFSTARYYPNIKDSTNCRGIRPDIYINSEQMTDSELIPHLKQMIKD